MTDSVVSPSHYVSDAPTLEPMDLTMRLPHPLASAFEYVYRAGKKPGVAALTDLQKARVWLSRTDSLLKTGLLEFPPMDQQVPYLLFLFSEKNELAEALLSAYFHHKDSVGENDLWRKIVLTALDFVKERIAFEQAKEKRVK